MNTLRDLQAVSKDLREKHPVIHSTIVVLTGVGAAVVALSANSLVQKMQY
jgi:hypothetical protein